MQFAADVFHYKTMTYRTTANTPNDSTRNDLHAYQFSRFVAWTKDESFVGRRYFKTPYPTGTVTCCTVRILKLQFLQEYSGKLPYREPDNSIAEDRTEVGNLQSRIKELELEVSILRQTLKDLVSR